MIIKPKALLFPRYTNSAITPNCILVMLGEGNDYYYCRDYQNAAYVSSIIRVYSNGYNYMSMKDIVGCSVGYSQKYCKEYEQAYIIVKDLGYL